MRTEMSGLTSNSRARVKIEIEITVSDNWGPECTVAQVHAQALESAKQKLVDIFRGGSAKIIGTPVITMVLVDAK